MQQNMYVISQNINTDINGTTLNFTLGNNDPTVNSNPMLPQMMGSTFSFSIQNPVKSDLNTFVFGAQVTLSVTAKV
jgi:hypothetical protein